MDKRMLEMKVAGEEARPYLEALDRNHVPYSLAPEVDEDTRETIGIQVGVDAVGLDGWSQFVVIPFYEDGRPGEGFVTSTKRLDTFERSSLELDALALGLAECRRGHRKVVIEDTNGFKILKFRTRY